MSLRTPDVVEFDLSPQPAPCGRGSETQCADAEPRPKGAECVRPNWLKSISPRIAQLRGRPQESRVSALQTEVSAPRQPRFLRFFSGSAGLYLSSVDNTSTRRERILARAQYLSLPSTNDHGASVVLVFTSISSTASS